jgi:aminopeptidase N
MSAFAGYEAALKIPYPLTKVDLVGIPDFQAGAMENWGLVTFREVDLLVPGYTADASKEASEVTGEKPSVQQLYRVPTVVAHELAHMWFGGPFPPSVLICWASMQL